MGGMSLDTSKMMRDNSFNLDTTKMIRDSSFNLDTTKMMRDSSFNLNTHVDISFLDPSITADPGLLQSLDALRSPHKDTLSGTPPPSPRVMMSPASMCTSPTSDLF